MSCITGVPPANSSNPPPWEITNQTCKLPHPSSRENPSTLQREPAASTGLTQRNTQEFYHPYIPHTQRPANNGMRSRHGRQLRYSTPVAGNKYEDDQEAGDEEGEGQQQQHMDEERTPEPEDHQLRYGDQDEGNHRFSYGDEQITPGAENGKEQQSGEAEEQEGEEGRDAQATAAEDGQHQQEEDGDSGAAAAAMAAAAAAVPVPAEAPRRASLDKQGSAGSGGKGGYAQLPAMELSHSMPSFKENSSPEARIPSYLRATTSFKAHTGKLVRGRHTFCWHKLSAHVQV
eukprot:1149475-Pelagomonas_calceolata.AAC.7